MTNSVSSANSVSADQMIGRLPELNHWRYGAYFPSVKSIVEVDIVSAPFRVFRGQHLLSNICPRK